MSRLSQIYPIDPIKPSVVRNDSPLSGGETAQHLNLLGAPAARGPPRSACGG